MSKPRAPRVSPVDLAKERPDKAPAGNDLARGEQLGSVSAVTDEIRWDAVLVLALAQERRPMPLGDVRLILAMLDLDPAALLGHTAPVPVHPPAEMSVLDSTCPDCDAEVGQRCWTRSGKEAPSVHASRWRIWKEQR